MTIRSRMRLYNLSIVLGNTDGRFTWFKKGFVETARELSLEELAIFAKLRKMSGDWAADSLRSNGKPIEQVNVDVFTLGVAATGSYLGAEANVSLFKAEGGLRNLGIGVDTGVGIKNDSLNFI